MARVTTKKPVVKKETKKPSAKVEKASGLTLNVVDITGKAAGKITLPEEIFGVEANNALLAQAVRVARANQRQGTQSTKTRSEVAGSTRKVYKQKGTGRARHGDIKAPIYIGGGIAHGPKPRDFSLNLPKKMKRKALFMSLSLAVKSNNIIVVVGLDKIKAKTKEMVDALIALGLENKKKGIKALLVTRGNDENIVKAGRNIKGLAMLSANMLNTYDVLNSQKIVLMKEAIDVVKSTFAKEN